LTREGDETWRRFPFCQLSFVGNIMSNLNIISTMVIVVFSGVFNQFFVCWISANHSPTPKWFGWAVGTLNVWVVGTLMKNLIGTYVFPAFHHTSTNFYSSWNAVPTHFKPWPTLMQRYSRVPLGVMCACMGVCLSDCCCFVTGEISSVFF
jgi:hypothetical protein